MFLVNQRCARKLQGGLKNWHNVLYANNLIKY